MDDADDIKVQMILDLIMKTKTGFIFITQSNDIQSRGECVRVGIPMDVALDSWIGSCLRNKLTPIEIQNKFNAQMLQVLMMAPVDDASKISDN